MHVSYLYFNKIESNKLGQSRNVNFCTTIVNEPTFDIGNTAISNDLITEDRLNSPEKMYPLIFYICPQCLLAQTEQYNDEIFV